MTADPSLPDPRAVGRAFDRVAAHAAGVDVIAGRVRDQMLERLDLVRIDPALVVDAGCGTGTGTAALTRRFPRSRVLALDISPRMLAQAGRRSRWRRRFGRVCADLSRLPVADRSAGLIFSNLALPWCTDLERVFAGFARAMDRGALLSFTTFGPDTLRELREAWSGIDDTPHVQRFFDMHDIGDALLRSGLDEPVMDVERFTLTYRDLPAMLKEIRDAGAGNLAAGRRRGLTVPGTLAALSDRYESLRRDGRLPLSVEVIYGQAWGRGELRDPDRHDAEVAVPLSKVGRRR